MKTSSIDEFLRIAERIRNEFRLIISLNDVLDDSPLFLSHIGPEKTRDQLSDAYTGIDNANDRVSRLAVKLDAVSEDFLRELSHEQRVLVHRLVRAAQRLSGPRFLEALEDAAPELLAILQPGQIGRRGVAYYDAALIISEGDEVEAKALAKKWGKNKSFEDVPKLGTDPSHGKRLLSDVSEIAKKVADLEGLETSEKRRLERALESKARPAVIKNRLNETE